MSLQWRPMQQKDVATCVEIIASHPVIGPRYGPAIKNLRSAWLRLLGTDAMTTAVYEEVEDRRITVIAFGVGVFVHDDFVREMKAPPLFWFGPELARRVTEGDTPVLTDRQVREGNSGEGLNELVWEALMWPKFAKRSELYHLMGNAFIEIHRGFRFKEMFTAQAESAERLQWAVDAGGMYWDPQQQCYSRSLKGDAEEWVTRPHVIGFTRELELARPGSWVGVLFNYSPPQIGFSRAEQQLLLAALRGEGSTDEELAATLRLAVPTVKKIWTSVYSRSAACLPDLTSDHSRSDHDATQRGKEKRRHLLAYLRDHPEELRPVSRKTLLRVNSPQNPGAASTLNQ